MPHPDCPPATAVTVAYRTEVLDLGWVPADATVLVVHNDDRLTRSIGRRSNVVHIGDGANIGYGAAVNVALPYVQTERTILFNPDTVLDASHWKALSSGGPHDLVVVPLVDSDGRPTSMVNRYPTPLSAVLTALRLGRLLPRHSRLRRALVPLLGQWGRDHGRSLTEAGQVGSWSASTHWPCAAACSYPTALLKAVGGFDPGYFLYLEDVDLSRRMAIADPALTIVEPATHAGMHLVSASSRSAEGRKRADLEQARSAARYAKSEHGPAWRVAGAIASGLALARQMA